MRLLKSVNPGVSLPDGFEALLWEQMEVRPIKHRGVDTLEQEGEVPSRAYFVVHGYVLIYGYNIKFDRYVWRIYRKNSIVALNDFLVQEESAHCIVAMPGALVWTISIETMQEIYGRWEGMREFAWQTAGLYSELKEKSRASLLAIEGKSDRVSAFYHEYNQDGVLLPPGKVIKDRDIADYLNINTKQFRYIRAGLKNEGKLIY